MPFIIDHSDRGGAVSRGLAGAADGVLLAVTLAQQAKENERRDLALSLDADFQRQRLDLERERLDLTKGLREAAFLGEQQQAAAEQDRAAQRVQLATRRWQDLTGAQMDPQMEALLGSVEDPIKFVHEAAAETRQREEMRGLRSSVGSQVARMLAAEAEQAGGLPPQPGAAAPTDGQAAGPSARQIRLAELAQRAEAASTVRELESVRDEIQTVRLEEAALADDAAERVAVIARLEPQIQAFAAESEHLPESKARLRALRLLMEDFGTNPNPKRTATERADLLEKMAQFQIGMAEEIRRLNSNGGVERNRFADQLQSTLAGEVARGMLKQEQAREIAAQFGVSLPEPPPPQDKGAAGSPLAGGDAEKPITPRAIKKLAKRAGGDLDEKTVREMRDIASGGDDARTVRAIRLRFPEIDRLSQAEAEALYANLLGETP